MRNIEEIIARNIIMKLDELSIDQTELAARTKISRKTINSIINRKQDGTRPATRDAIAKALGITRAELEHEPITMSQLAGINRSESDLGVENRALRDRIRTLESYIESIPEHYLSCLKDASDEDKRAFEAMFGLDQAEVPSKKIKSSF